MINPARNQSVNPYFKLVPATALAIALIATTICLGFRLDWDRTLPLLFMPALLALYLGRHYFPTGCTIYEKYLLAATTATCCLSNLLADHPARATAMLSASILTLAGAVVAARIAGHARSVRILLIGMAASALIGLVIVRGIIKPGGEIPLYGHARILGVHLLTGTVAALALLHTLPSRRRWTFAATAITTCILAGGMIWSGGRGPLVGFAVGLTAWLWLCPARQRKPLFITAGIVLIIGLIVAICLGSPHRMMGWNYSIDRSLKAETVNDFSSGRMQFWEATFDNFTKRPWVGHGADSYLFIRPSQIGAQPHNFILQWLGDFGLVGTLALLGLLISRVRQAIASAGKPLNRAAFFGFVACTVAALLDGGFYHAILFMPAALLAGLSAAPSKRTNPASLKWLTPLGGSLVGMASIVILLNGWLYYRLKATPAPSAQSTSATLLRIFPSNVHGLWNWLDEWKKTDPQIATDWAIWAQSHAIHPELFGIYTARCFLEQKQFTAAENELREILTYLDKSRQPAIQKMINEVGRQAALAQQPKNAP